MAKVVLDWWRQSCWSLTQRVPIYFVSFRFSQVHLPTARQYRPPVERALERSRERERYFITRWPSRSVYCFVHSFCNKLWPSAVEHQSSKLADRNGGRLQIHICPKLLPQVAELPLLQVRPQHLPIGDPDGLVFATRERLSAAIKASLKMPRTKEQHSTREIDR